MADNSIPGLSVSTDPAPPPGLINAAPMQPVTGVPGVPAPPQAQATQATPSAAAPVPFQVTPEQTVSGQIKNIIAAGSPLMQQAETNAKNAMNQRGLINSSQGITAGQSALYNAATPIATADANTYAKAATDTTTAQNAALTAEALAKNTTSSTNAQLGTAVSQTNAQIAGTLAQTTAQIAGAMDVAQVQSATSRAIAGLQSKTTLSAQDKQDAAQQLIASIQANTAITQTDKQTISNQIIAQLQSTTTLEANRASIAGSKDVATLQGNISKAIAEIQASTSMTNQDKQDATSKIIADINQLTQFGVADKSAAVQKLTTELNNGVAKQIAEIQKDTTLKNTDKQTLSAQLIAGLNNDNAREVQKIVNEGNLEAIKTSKGFDVQMTQMANDNKLLLQTSQAASSLYGQTLVNMAAIMANKDFNQDQKTSALNTAVSSLNEGLKIINSIATGKGITTSLTFGGGSGNGPQIKTTTMQTSVGPVTSTPGLDGVNKAFAAQGYPQPGTPGFTNFLTTLKDEYESIDDPAVIDSQIQYQMTRLSDPVYGASVAELLRTLRAQRAKLAANPPNTGTGGADTGYNPGGDFNV